MRLYVLLLLLPLLALPLPWLAGAAEMDVNARKAGHWCWQPVADPLVPAVKDTAWPRIDIDRLLLAEMEARELAPGPDADAASLCRRLHFVLTGLPPSVAEVESFVMAHHANAAGAVTARADELMRSVHFGEHWAQHWMDVIRYAETSGHEYDFDIEGVWRYRDYLIRAIQADVPYDQFVREHICGDLIEPPRIDAASGRNESFLGTGWWHLGEGATAPVDLPNDEGDRIDNQIDTLGKAFQALTIGCARCHDHKADAITQRDYYALFGICAGTPLHRSWANEAALLAVAKEMKAARDEAWAKASHPVSTPASAPALELQKEHRLFADFSTGIPADWRLAGCAEVVTAEAAPRISLQPGLWTGTLTKKLPALLRSPAFTIDCDTIDILAAGQDATIIVAVDTYTLIRNPIYGGLRVEMSGGADELKWNRVAVGRWRGNRAYIEFFTGKQNGDKRIRTMEDTAAQQFGVRAIVFSNGVAPPVTAKLTPIQPLPLPESVKKLEEKIPLPERFPGVAEMNGRDLPLHIRGDATKPAEAPTPRRFLEALPGAGHAPIARGSGRRELAEALLSPQNPLTGRVMVNRIWQHLFGRGIVPSVDNFGKLGEPPSHPQLLDYLATRFVRHHHWSMKGLIREILGARAWQLAAAVPPPLDSANQWLSRYPIRRMEAESIRDSLFAVSGQLDRTPFGPSVPIHLTPQMPTSNRPTESGPLDGNRRRSIYTIVRRNFPHPFLALFDKPQSSTAFGRRSVTNVPTQALAMLNDLLVLQQAEAWAKRIESSPGTPEEKARQMHREAFGRDPSNEELTQALALAEGGARWTDLAHALFNCQEFLLIK